MGLLDDYGLDVDDIPTGGGFSNPKDGIYEFEVNSFKLVEGSTNNPEWDFLVLGLTITDEDGASREFNQWFHLPNDPLRLTESEKNTLGRMKGLLLDFGVPENKVNSVEEEDLVGITGTFQLVSRKSKSGTVFQNINNVRVDEAEAPAPEPVKKPRAARKPRAAAPTSAPEPEVSLPQQELAAVEADYDPATQEAEPEPDSDIKARIAERREARRRQAAPGGERVNVFAPQE